MTANNDNTTLLTRYLLGELAEEEEGALEERFFGDADLLDELRSVERELADSYVRGELRGESRERFELRFLASPSRRERVLLADAVAATDVQRWIPDRKNSDARPSKDSWFSWFVPSRRMSWALAASVVIVVTSALFWERIWREQTPATQMAEVRTEAPPPAPADPVPAPEPKPDVTPTPPQSASKMATFVLAPRVRSGRGQRLEIDRDKSSVQLVIPVRLRDYTGYLVVLRTASGGEVWKSGQLKLRGRDGSLAVRVPAGNFRTGEYMVVVSGVSGSAEPEEIADYYFDVVRR